MPLPPSRVLRTFRYAVYFDGADDHAVIPLTVYGWSSITVQEWLYPYHPKANVAYTKFNMIGDYWTDHPSVFWGTNNRYDYTTLELIFTIRKPDGALGSYPFSIFAYRNTWVNTAYRFSIADRMLAGYVNGGRVYSATVPSTEYTVLEWNPDTATRPWMYRRFVLGASVEGRESMKMMQFQLLIYSRVLSDSEIAWNYWNPDNPVRNGLVIWLQADPQYIMDIDGDGVLEWVDLSGSGNHGKIYGARLVELIRTPAR